MPMPTTRRGRFLYFRARSQRRRKREQTRTPGLIVSGNRATCRRKYWNLWGKQEPTTIKGDVYFDGTWDWESPAAWITQPAYKRWGVIADPNDYLGLPPYTHHPTTATVGYQRRRVLSIPSARQREWQPYRHPKEALPPTQFYGLEFYPSGQQSYASLQGWL